MDLDFSKDPTEIVERLKEVARPDGGEVARRWRANRNNPPPPRENPRTGRGLSLDQRVKIYRDLETLEQELAQHKMNFQDLNFEMEQTAEIEGGPIADRIGTEMQRVLDQIKRTEKRIHKLQNKLAER